MISKLLVTPDGTPAEIPETITRRDKIGICIVALILTSGLFLGIFSIASGVRHYFLPTPVLQDLTMDDVSNEPYEVGWVYGHGVLDQALTIWRDSTGGAEIDRPTLWIGSCFAARALACANLDKHRITFTSLYVQTREVDDTLTIMLHEVGHLYGVPHVDGDPLMTGDGLINGVHEPTRIDIAIAKTLKEKK